MCLSAATDKHEAKMAAEEQTYSSGRGGLAGQGGTLLLIKKYIIIYSFIKLYLSSLKTYR